MYGDVTKEKLDDLRAAHFTETDMMSNTSINYHPESINEMQIICIAVIWSFLYVPTTMDGQEITGR